MTTGEHIKNTFEKLDLTADEADRFTKAFKDEEFRKMFIDYAKEISDPENRKKYEEEITQLENERGMDVKFVHPKPGFVMKSKEKPAKIFINFCTNDFVGKPTNTKQGNGISWSIPYSLSPPREETGKNGILVKIFDVVYNPDTLRMANSNLRFKEIVKQTAFEGFVERLKEKLILEDFKELKNLKYKGTPNPTVIRHRLDNGDCNITEKVEDKGILPKFPYPYGNNTSEELAEKSLKIYQPKKDNLLVSKQETKSEYTLPKYTIKHSSNMDLQKYTISKTSENIPDQIIITIYLPLLKSANSVDLNIFKKKLTLKSEIPGKYELNLPLPYVVNEDEGSAKFDKSKKCLIVTLNVIKPTNVPEKEVDHNDIKLVTENQVNSVIDDYEIQPDIESNYSKYIDKKEILTNETDCQSSIYISPSIKISQLLNSVSVIISVKYVDKNSINIAQTDTECVIKFKSIGSGGFPMKYLLHIKFNHEINKNVTTDISENEFVLIFFKKSDQFWDNLLIKSGSNKDFEVIDFDESLPSTNDNNISNGSTNYDSTVNINDKQITEICNSETKSTDSSNSDKEIITVMNDNTVNTSNNDGCNETVEQKKTPRSDIKHVMFSEDVTEIIADISPERQINNKTEDNEVLIDSKTDNANKDQKICQYDDDDDDDDTVKEPSIKTTCKDDEYVNNLDHRTVSAVKLQNDIIFELDD